MQQRLLVKFSCNSHNDICLWDLLLVPLLVFVTSDCHNNLEILTIMPLASIIYHYTPSIILPVLSESIMMDLFFFHSNFLFKVFFIFYSNSSISFLFSLSLILDLGKKRQRWQDKVWWQSQASHIGHSHNHSVRWYSRGNNITYHKRYDNFIYIDS